MKTRHEYDRSLPGLLDRLFHRRRVVEVPLLVLDRLLFMAIQMTGALPDPQLSVTERRVLGAHLQPEAAILIQEVASGLSRYRDLFPELPHDPKRMEAALVRASRWSGLRAFGENLCRIADTYYMVEIVAQLKDALAIVRHVRADRQRVYPGPNDADRRRAMADAEEVLQEMQRRIKGQAHRPATAGNKG